MALPVFRAAGAKSETAVATVTVAAPAGVATGDLEILVAEADGGSTLSITTNGGSAWTLMTGLPNITGTSAVYVWWRIRQAGDSDPVITDANPDHVCACRLAYQVGTFDTSDPFEIEATTSLGAGTNFSWAPGTSTTGSDRLVLCLGSTGVDSASPQVPVMTNSALTALASRANYCTASGSGGGFGITEGAKAAAGAVGTFACTYVTSTGRNGVSFAIKPVSLVPVSASDSGVGDDPSTLTVPNSLTDSGAGAEDPSALISNLPTTESGTDTEIAALNVVATATDTGAGSETSNVRIVTSDSGTGSEASAIRISATDSGAGSEASTLTASISRVESGTDSETSSIGVATTDSGTGDEISTLVAKYVPVETGTGSDVSTLTFSVSVVDSGAGAEASTLAASASVVDSGTGSEISTLTAAYTLVDTGSGSEVSAQTISVTDSGIGSEISTPVFAPLLVTDVGAGADVSTLSAGNQKNASDSGLGTEISTANAALALTDTGTSTETPGSRTITVSDSGTDSEIATLGAGVAKSGTDSGTGSEISTTQAVSATSETASGTDTAFLTFLFSTADTGSGIDSSQRGVVFTLVDSGTGSEIPTLIASLLALDIGAGSEVSDLRISAAHVFVSDSGIADEIATVLQKVMWDQSDAGIGSDRAQVLGDYFIPSWSETVLVSTSKPGQMISSMARRQKEPVA